MSGTRMAAIVLIAAGALSLIYGSFSYTKDTHEAQIGSLELTMKERKSVNIPVWMGLGAVVAGVVLLVPRRRS